MTMGPVSNGLPGKSVPYPFDFSPDRNAVTFTGLPKHPSLVVPEGKDVEIEIKFTVIANTNDFLIDTPLPSGNSEIMEAIKVQAARYYDTDIKDLDVWDVLAYLNDEKRLWADDKPYKSTKSVTVKDPITVEINMIKGHSQVLTTAWGNAGQDLH